MMTRDGIMDKTIKRGQFMIAHAFIIATIIFYDAFDLNGFLIQTGHDEEISLSFPYGFL